MSDVRVEEWKRKLLDLSLRNPLLNVRDGNKFLPLSAGVTYVAGTMGTGIVPYDGTEVGGGMSFKSTLDEATVKKRLKELYLTSRSMYNESGVNSLYVAVGCLCWNEKSGAELRRAPILLIPARLVRQSAAPGYRLERTEEDAVVNFCVVEMLRSQFGLTIPDIDGGGFGDGDPNFDETFGAFAKAIAGHSEWSIITDTALGIFSFSKVVIWKDLTDHLGAFKRQPLVAHLAEGRGLYDDHVEVFDPDAVEKQIDPSRLWCPMSADSSQLAAVLYSELGKSFVLHGPPGTGKSQTITNLIAHNLALGKRVLFVSEKKAALDVVYKRLEACGLAPFCLELHSNKADKANVMRQFAESLALPQSRNPANWVGTCAGVTAAFRELGAYVDELHRPAKNGLSAYACLDRRVTKHPAATAALIPFAAADSSPEALHARTETIRDLADEWKGVDPSAYAALAPVLTKDWSPAFETEVATRVEALLAALDEPAAWKRVPSVLFKALAARCAGTLAYPFGRGFGDAARTILKGVSDHLGGLRLVEAYRVTRAKAVRAGCEKFVLALERGDFSADEAERIFTESCSEKTLDQLVSRSRALSSFSGVKQEERIARFRELDEKYHHDVRRAIVAKLAKRVHETLNPQPPKKEPDGTVRRDPIAELIQRELGLLKRESEKKKRFLPPRRLLAETSTIATRLKPCFLMSPLSVAQYLPASSDLFDLIVFDEASQMTTWDAVGVIARGRQLIVVGDPKQLPPTNFFTKGEAKDEDSEEDVGPGELESVLDECLASGLRSAFLGWHYRSRHESLIAFSNRHYYEDRLNTFPSAVTREGLGVSFRAVPGGTFEHGAHTNRKEAEALVDFLFTRLADPKERARSYGVVTFSAAQQRLIEDLVEEKSQGLAWAADYFDESKPDAFFVKNLENVQGDERDAIVFSVAYAPDEKGRFAMAFGPLNRAGGERRLNVAITRAREEVVLFASIKAGDIKAERTNSVGVRHLKALMEYAETGHLDGEATRAATMAPTGLRKVVCDWLDDHGYTYDLDVGRSSAPIEVAVKDPQNPTRYALGLLFDGAHYAHEKTVRDRDVLRPSVLAALGWKTHRIWSLDWAYDRPRAEASLKAALMEG